jgi:hypothetical protein
VQRLRVIAQRLPEGHGDNSNAEPGDATDVVVMSHRSSLAARACHAFHRDVRFLGTRAVACTVSSDGFMTLHRQELHNATCRRRSNQRVRSISGAAGAPRISVTNAVTYRLAGRTVSMPSGVGANRDDRTSRSERLPHTTPP